MDQDEGTKPLEPTADCIHPKVVEDCMGDFCRIEPGCFIMGAPPELAGRGLVDSDQVQVTLTHAFWIGRTEVTRKQWDKSELPRPELRQLNGSVECTDPQCPQGNATTYEILAYVNRLSEIDGKKPCYTLAGTTCTGTVINGDYACPTITVNAASPYECEGYRLPTEAEWEYAARAGTTTAFFNGDITPQRDQNTCYPDSALDEIGWYCMNSSEQAHEVALKRPNAWGLYDMHGNVSEMVNELYSPSGYLIGPYGKGSGPLVDPTGTMTPANDLTFTPQQTYRGRRGGVYNYSAVLANVSHRTTPRPPTLAFA